jgi:hypothetical protein
VRVEVRPRSPASRGARVPGGTSQGSQAQDDDDREIEADGGYLEHTAEIVKLAEIGELTKHEAAQLIAWAEETAVRVRKGLDYYEGKR